MVDTPTVWKPQYQVKPDNFDNGGDFFSNLNLSAIDIGMGRYVEVWTANSGPTSSSPGRDLIGQIFDAKGNPIGSAFQVNHAFTADDETKASLASRPGGGFVVAYEDEGSIRVETYDVHGIRNTKGPFTIAEKAGSYNPEIAMRPDGSYLVTYQTGTEIVGRIVSTSGVVGNQFTINNDSDWGHSDAAALTDRNYVVVDSVGYTGIRFTIISPTGVLLVSGLAASSTTASLLDVHVTALTGGGFVMTWHEWQGGIKARIYDNAGTAVGMAFSVMAQTLPDAIGSPDITALQDGGFVITYLYSVYNDTAAEYDSEVRAQRYDAAGTKVGTEFLAGFGNPSHPTIALLGDGRFIVSFQETKDADFTDARVTIFDPRGDDICGTNKDDVLTSRLDGAEVVGKKGKDILLGSDGHDRLHGGRGDDKLAGGLDEDNLRGGRGHDKFVFDTALGNGNVDRIRDMHHKTDKIWLDMDIFPAIGKKLISSEFQKGSHAADGNDFIIYKQSNGNLFYDPDGDGPVGKIKFATVDPGTKIDKDNCHMIHDLVI